VSALKVVFVQTDGVEKVVEDAEAGQSLLTISRANAVSGILGDCGGCCSCATCHVYVDPQWQGAVGAGDDVETSTLEMAEDAVQQGSRLCCQITLRPELNGLRVSVAPSV
jgi:2Fe-2S ferredoxin